MPTLLPLLLVGVVGMAWMYQLWQSQRVPRWLAIGSSAVLAVAYVAVFILVAQAGS